MLKVLPSRSIPLISAGHEEYTSKGRGEAGEAMPDCGASEWPLVLGKVDTCHVGPEVAPNVCRPRGECVGPKGSWAGDGV